MKEIRILVNSKSLLLLFSKKNIISVEMDNSRINKPEKNSNRAKTCLSLFFHLCSFLDVSDKIAKKDHSICRLFTKEILKYICEYIRKK